MMYHKVFIFLLHQFNRNVNQINRKSATAKSNIPSIHGVTMPDYRHNPANETTNETPNESTDGTTYESADESQNKNIKNDKNVKNEKKERKGQAVYYPNDELLNNAFKAFLTMRNKIKKPLATKQALTRMMNKIEKLSCGDNDLAIKILNQSTDHCWQDVYELKSDSGGNRTGNSGIDWDNVQEVQNDRE